MSQAKRLAATAGQFDHNVLVMYTVTKEALII